MLHRSERRQRNEHSLQSRVASSFSADSQAVPVVMGQIMFMGYGYLDALICGELSWEKLHISAVLDHNRRALFCAIMAVLMVPFMCWAEDKRSTIPFRTLRITLAACCGLGIVLTCLVRESACFVLHAGGACMAFGAAVVLILVVASHQPEAKRASSIRHAVTLMVVCGVTGTAQFLKIAGLTPFPSWALAAGECIMVILFGCAISLL